MDFVEAFELTYPKGDSVVTEAVKYLDGYDIDGFRLGELVGFEKVIG